MRDILLYESISGRFCDISFKFTKTDSYTKMADQKGSEVYIAFTMTLCGCNFLCSVSYEADIHTLALVSLHR